MDQRTPISVNWSPSSQHSSYSGEIEAFLQAQMCLICLASSIESTSNTTTLSCGLLAALLMLSCSPLYSATLLLTPMPRYSRAFSAGGPLPKLPGGQYAAPIPARLPPSLPFLRLAPSDRYTAQNSLASGGGRIRPALLSFCVVVLQQCINQGHSKHVIITSANCSGVILLSKLRQVLRVAHAAT